MCFAVFLVFQLRNNSWQLADPFVGVDRLCVPVTLLGVHTILPIRTSSEEYVLTSHLRATYDQPSKDVSKQTCRNRANLNWLHVLTHPLSQLCRDQDEE